MRKILLLLSLLLVPPAYAGRNFNGTSDTISIPGSGNAIDITTGSMTISFWMFPTSNSAENDPVSKWSGGNQWLFDYNFGGNGKIDVNVHQTGIPNHNNVTCGTVLTLNIWYQVAMTWDTVGGTLTIFLNGSSCGFVSNNGSIVSNSANVFVGTTGGTSNFFHGEVAEVGIWNVALKNNEIKSLGLGISPNRVRRLALVGYWPLYGASGISSEPDMSGNGINGAITGTTVGAHCPCNPPAGGKQ